jgi:hypothetical protein
MSETEEIRKIFYPKKDEASWHCRILHDMKSFGLQRLSSTLMEC